MSGPGERSRNHGAGKVTAMDVSAFLPQRPEAVVGYAALLACGPSLLIWSLTGRLLRPLLLNLALAMLAVLVATTPLLPSMAKVLVFPIWGGGFAWVLASEARRRRDRAARAPYRSNKLGPP